MAFQTLKLQTKQTEAHCIRQRQPQRAMTSAMTTNAPATFIVQLVRRRHGRHDGAAASLQVLNQAFCLHIDPSCLTLVVANAAPHAPAVPAHSSILRYFARERLAIAPASSEHRAPTQRVWLSVRAGLVASVRVKGRMLRVAMHDRQTLRCVFALCVFVCEARVAHWSLQLACERCGRSAWSRDCNDGCMGCVLCRPLWGMRL